MACAAPCLVGELDCRATLQLSREKDLRPFELFELQIRPCTPDRSQVVALLGKVGTPVSPRQFARSLDLAQQTGVALPNGRAALDYIRFPFSH